MPYITEDKRKRLDPHITAIVNELSKMEMDNPENNFEGNMNYLISSLLDQCYARPTTYANINDAVGLLGCITQEFYRKIAVPYEAQKEFENGEVFTVID